MSERDLSHYIPARLDDSGKFLFWERDVASVALLGIFVGIGTGFPIIGVVGGAGLAYAYSRLKSGSHPGMATHLAYWFTGIPEPKELPGSHLREFNG